MSLIRLLLEKKIDKPVRTGLECKKLPAEKKDGETLKDLDFRSTPDTAVLTDSGENIKNFDIEKESKFCKSNKKDAEKRDR